MPSPNPVLLVFAMLTALSAVGQLRIGAVKELAAGKLLVAARGLVDPNFRETVILLVEHNDEGSMGLVINRRSDVPLARIFPNLKSTAGEPSLIYVGGPVSPDGVLALVRSEAPKADTRRVVDDVYLIASPEGLDEQLAAGTDRSRFRVYLGYAGWGPGQLERETTQGAWHVFRGEPAVVFDADAETVWERQIVRTQQRMARLLPAVLAVAGPTAFLSLP
jgi:putative transcriptional regulator